MSLLNHLIKSTPLPHTASALKRRFVLLDTNPSRSQLNLKDAHPAFSSFSQINGSTKPKLHSYFTLLPRYLKPGTPKPGDEACEKLWLRRDDGNKKWELKIQSTRGGACGIYQGSSRVWKQLKKFYLLPDLHLEVDRSHSFSRLIEDQKLHIYHRTESRTSMYVADEKYLFTITEVSRTFPLSHERADDVALFGCVSFFKGCSTGETEDWDNADLDAWIEHYGLLIGDVGGNVGDVDNELLEVAEKYGEW